MAVGWIPPVRGGRSRRRRVVVATLMLGLTVAGCGGGGSGGPPTLHWYIGKQGSSAYTDDAAACTKAANGAYRIQVVDLPADADAQREQLVRRLAAKDSAIDIIGMDVIWTAEFAKAGWVKEWTGDRATSIEAGAVPTALGTAKFEDKLWASPQNTNAQVLFWRKDLIPDPPRTWDEMIDAAVRLGPKGRIEAQGARYEGLTVWFNSLVASAGGAILTPDGKVSLGPPAVEALRVMKRLASSPAADPSLSNDKEDQSTAAFVAGNAAFMVNYSAVLPSLSKQAPDLVTKVGIAPWPSVLPDQPAHVTLGGYNLGVAKFTHHSDQAFAAASCLTSAESQLHNAATGGLPPTIESLYNDPAVAGELGPADVLHNTLLAASQRPATPAYNDVSLAVQKTIHPEKSINPKSTESDLRSKLGKVLKSGGLI
ncbi:MAG: ABC transporter substrate-binding protein [Actinomycetota bacterium]|nr:ABC transporter substrate-binding protein [Actinomycetota bacterium]